MMLLGEELRMPPQWLPFGSEFSPKQIELPILLELADAHGADWHSFEVAVRLCYFADRDTTEENSRKLANNTKLALRSYGLVGEDDVTLTGIGRSLYDLRNDPEQLAEAFAGHILRECHGTAFVQCILDMQAAGERVTLVSLRSRLEEYGITVSRGSKNMSTLRLWLEKAGVFVSGYQVDQGRFYELLGVTPEELDVLATFTPEQRSYLKALANIGGGGPHSSSDIEKLATTTYGTEFNEKGLPRQVLRPLEQAGYILLDRGTAGRGAKPYRVTATQKLDNDVITPLFNQLAKQAMSDLRPMLRKRISEIRDDLKSADQHVRGLALEALAFKLMHSVGLIYVGTRLRGRDTGGAEVDLIFDSDRLVFSRWQVQCKNAKSVHLDDVAKEVGLTHFLKSNAVVIVTTGRVGTGAREYANAIMQNMNLCIVMIEGHDLDMIARRPPAIVDVLHREAKHAMQLKVLEL